MDKWEFKTSVHNERRVTPEPQRRKDKSDDPAMKKLMRNAVICVALLVCLMGIKTFDGADDSDLPDAGQASSSQLAEDEDIGQLQFISQSYTEPVEDSEVVSVFSGDNMSVSLRGEEGARVLSVMDGVVTEIGDDFVKMENDNGTITEYHGLRPCIHAGEELDSAQVIGYLGSKELVLTTVGSTGYLDTLDQEEMTEAAVNCE